MKSTYYICIIKDVKSRYLVSREALNSSYRELTHPYINLRSSGTPTKIKVTHKPFSMQIKIQFQTHITQGYQKVHLIQCCPNQSGNQYSRTWIKFFPRSRHKFFCFFVRLELHCTLLEANFTLITLFTTLPYIFFWMPFSVNL